jgi:hypothetical protein
MDKATHPWSVPVALEDIPETGLHLEFDAPDSVRSALAELVGVRDVPKLSAVFDLTRRGAGIQVDGRIEGRVGQTCVVTLEPIENEVAETVDLRFTPQETATTDDLKAVAERYAAADDEEPPEPLIGGKVDLGAIATEFLMLGIDPYPRKPGAAFSAPKADESGHHPFAALEALKKGPGGGKS